VAQQAPAVPLARAVRQRARVVRAPWEARQALVGPAQLEPVARRALVERVQRARVARQAQVPQRALAVPPARVVTCRDVNALGWGLERSL
jgi:hypothetical protein